MRLLAGTIVALVLVIATWAAVDGPRELVRGDGPSPAETTPSAEPPPRSSPEDEPSPADDDEEGDVDTTPAPDWVRWLATGIQIALLAGIAVTLLVVVWSLWQGLSRPRRRRRLAEDPEAPEPLPPEEAVAAVIAEDAERHRSVLRQGSPRNAIVACWDRFEQQAAAGGVGREAWETPAEFTVRLLGLVSADDAAIARLAELYREARFSDHHLDEAARTDAMDALDRIHEGLRAGVRSGVRGDRGAS